MIKLKCELLSQNICLAKYYNYIVHTIYNALYKLIGELPAEIKNILENITNLDSAIQFKSDFIPSMSKIKDYFDDLKRHSSVKLCDDAIAIIDKNYFDSELTLNSLSDMLSCSSPYLSMLIKKHTGESFVSILTRKRMIMAEELIKSTDLKIAQVAEKSGYNDQQYFSYCYKKYHGISPLKSRNK